LKAIKRIIQTALYLLIKTRFLPMLFFTPLNVPSLLNLISYKIAPN